MGKFNKQLVTEVKREKEQEDKQKKLREKYNVQEDVMIIEKNNMMKFIVRTIGRIIKVITQISIFLLAVIGLAALIFPETRQELLKQAIIIWEELKEFINIL